jgi:hypothetical protein
MTRLRVLATLPLWFLLIAATNTPSPTPPPTTPPATTPTPTPIPTPTPTPTPPPSPTPSPTPSPSPSPNPNAYLTLDITAGGPNTLITVNGFLFIPKQSISLYWDQSNRVSGATDADASGNFTWKVKPFPGDPPGIHKLCASVAPNPCASFSLEAAVTTPSPDTSPTPEPSPSTTPITVATPARTDARFNGLEVMLKPPFVILPIIGGVGLVIALLYWLLSMVTRRRPPQTLKSVTVGHLASRPDYSAAFGAPPVAPASAEPMPSAWADVPRTNVAEASDAAAEEAKLPMSPPPYPPSGGGAEMTHDAVASYETPAVDAAAPPETGWSAVESNEPDPLLAAWADVLPSSHRGMEAPPPDAGEDTPRPETKPRSSHDDPLDFPEPGE